MRDELRRFAAAWRAATAGAAGAECGPDALRHGAGAGLLLGSAGALVLWAAAHLWPAGVATAVAMAALALLTRARHEQALANRFGPVALIGVLALQGLALHGLMLRDFTAALASLLLAQALSRAAVSLLAAAAHAARPAEAPGPGPLPAGGAASTAAMALVWSALALAAAAALGLPAGEGLGGAAAVAAVTLAFVVEGARREPVAPRGAGGGTAALSALQPVAAAALWLLLLALRSG